MNELLKNLRIQPTPTKPEAPRPSQAHQKLFQQGFNTAGENVAATLAKGAKATVKVAR